MSTILKALKQAEKDNLDSGGENHLSFNVRSVLSSRMQQQKKSSFLNLGRVVILTALFIVMAIVSYSLFFINKNIHPQMPNTAIKFFDLPKSPNKTVLKPEPNDRVPVGEKFSNIAKEKITAPSNTNPLKKTKESVPSKPADATGITSDDDTPLIVEETTLNHSEMKNPITGSEELLNKDTPKKEILPLENDNFKIQAIAWSEKPAGRIAVINDRVLREGDYFKSYRLVIIEMDSVILHYSGSDYRLKLRYQ